MGLFIQIHLIAIAVGLAIRGIEQTFKKGSIDPAIIMAILLVLIVHLQV